MVVVPVSTTKNYCNEDIEVNDKIDDVADLNFRNHKKNA